MRANPVKQQPPAQPIDVPKSNCHREYKYAGSPRNSDYSAVPFAQEIHSYRETFGNSVFLMELKEKTESYSDHSNFSEDLSSITSSEDDSSESGTPRSVKRESIDPTNVIGLANKRFNLETTPERLDDCSPDRNCYAIKNEVVNPITKFEDAYVGGLKGDRHQFPKELKKSPPNGEAKNETPDIEDEPVSGSSPGSVLAASSQRRNSDSELMFEMEE